MLLCQGGRFGGWALYIEDGKPAYDYNWLGMKRTTIASDQRLSAGDHTIAFDFEYGGDGIGDGGHGVLRVDGAAVAKGAIEATTPKTFSVEESADVGVDLGTAVVDAVGVGEESRYPGEIRRIVLEVGPVASD